MARPVAPRQRKSGRFRDEIGARSTRFGAAPRPGWRPTVPRPPGRTAGR